MHPDHDGPANTAPTDAERQIDPVVAAAIAWHAAAAVPGVIRLEPGLSSLVTNLASRARHQLRPGSGGETAPTEGVDATVRGSTVSVHVDLATDLGEQAVAVAHAVQAAVVVALRTDAGLEVTEVSVSILDIERRHPSPTASVGQRP